MGWFSAECVLRVLRMFGLSVFIKQFSNSFRPKFLDFGAESR